MERGRPHKDNPVLGYGQRQEARLLPGYILYSSAIPNESDVRIRPTMKMV